jgi:glycosyltransferase involved in cell wall biosynthesis
MAEPFLSVVIPSRDRCAVLRSTLDALDNQVGVGDLYEVIVADDGSTDATREMIRSRRYSFELRSLALEPGGPARARNVAIREARAPRVLLLGDDMIPAPENLRAHLDVSGDNDAGFLGMIEWDPEVGITDVMRFLAPEGPQFWFKGLTKGESVPWSSIVSANLSAPRRWFIEEPFDESFTEACMEDTELGLRWRRRGWVVRFQPEAVCFHHHAYRSIGPFLDRQVRAGAWSRTVIRKHPASIARLVLIPLGMTLIRGLELVAGHFDEADRERLEWDMAVRRAFFRGLFGRR